MNKRPAVFLDRDGTLTEPRHYPRRPADLVLQPDIGPPLRRLIRQGFALVVVTNQSGLARGFFTSSDLESMHAYLRQLLRSIQVELAGIYCCPHHPAGQVKPWAVVCDCRKPRPGLLRQAARELDLDPTKSWMVGDGDGDIAAGQRFGCRAVQVGPGFGLTTAQALWGIARATAWPSQRAAR